MNVVDQGPVERWHETVRSRDPSRLEALLAEDVVFLSPVVHAPQRGKAITTRYLFSAALAVLGGTDFRYVEQWIGTTSAVLEFVTAIDEWRSTASTSSAGTPRVGSTASR